FKDLPLVMRALGQARRVALLKGRRNYLCRYRLDLFHNSQQVQRENLHQWAQIRLWAARTQSGDLSEVATVPEESPLWSLATSNADNCLGQACPDWERCHLVSARRAAQEADLVVINHHLFFADIALKAGGFGEILPDADAFIFDEAHQLPEIATQFFGMHLSSRQISDLVQDISAEAMVHAHDAHAELVIKGQSIEMAIRDLRIAMEHRTSRMLINDLLSDAMYNKASSAFLQVLNAFFELSENCSTRAEGLRKIHGRLIEILEQWKKIGNPTADYVHYVELTRHGFIFKMQPIDIAPRFSALMQEKRRAWVFTSATLSVAGNFDHFKSSLGLTDCDEFILESPFNYAAAAKLYIPTLLPDPRDSHHTAALVDSTLPLIEANPGGSFFLFTSHRAMNEAAQRLYGRTTRRLLVQGTQSRRVLLDEFRNAGNALLLATSSFWEGVDVRGTALSCVIIDKLPFASPDDPLLKARVQRARVQGHDAFLEIQLPLAILALRQGVGRLIRDEADRGMLVIGDARLIEKPYGKAILASLPPMPLTRQRDVALEFISNLVL
ncbi:MAG: ATP-dependent DNA helicase, partial [Gammaproteobacteria bacterium]|nr:ATP-dependent DNA helicase [Gammaproteobacteria bacterium]